MPSVLRWRGYRFYFFSHEPNEPAHVHIDKAECTVKFWLQPVALARSIGFPARELTTLHKQVAENQQALLEAWHGYFGTERG